jgi:hypothetical protein
MEGMDMNDPDSVRASDNDRDTAMERLRVAAAEGRLTSEELAARTEMVRAAKTHGELAEITADRPGRPPRGPVVQETGRRWIVSVFGDITRRGSWPTRERMSPIAVFGDIDLDFRQATMPSSTVTIDAVAPFGNIDVLVPDGVQVDVGGFTLFGSKKIAIGNATTNESAAVIRLRGFTLFGSLKVSSS